MEVAVSKGQCLPVEVLIPSRSATELVLAPLRQKEKLTL